MIECSHCRKKISDPRKKCPHCNRDPLALFTCQNCFTTQELQQFCPSCQSPLSGPQTGKEIHYQNWIYFIRERLGSGGMGEVYRAIEFNSSTQTLREIAVKFNRDLDSPQKIQRFQREVQILMQLQNPHLTTIYNYIEIKRSDLITTQFIAMELLRGKSLEELLRDGPLPLYDAIEIYRQVAMALSEAHEKGIIHRDLKPSNIILINNPEDPPFTKLIDFGLSKHLFITSPLSSSGVILGTLWYMSPEQARGEEIDQRSDLFSLGVILYQMLTGKLPFPAENLYQLYQMHPQGPPPIPENIPPNIALLIESSLKFHPKDRPKNLRQCLKILSNSQNPDIKRKRKQLPLLSRKLLYLLLATMLSSAAFALFFISKAEQNTNSPPTDTADFRNHTPMQTEKPTPPKREEKIKKNEKKITSPPNRKLTEHRKEKRQKQPSPPTKVRVHIKTVPKCRLFLVKGEKLKPIPQKISLSPGNYTAICLSKKHKIRRKFKFRILPQKNELSIIKKWKKIPLKLLLLPWGYTYIDGFHYPQCQYGCNIELWEGTSTLVLKRPIQGTKKQITVHRQRLNISTKLLKLPPNRRIIKIRWK